MTASDGPVSEIANEAGLDAPSGSPRCGNVPYEMDNAGSYGYEHWIHSFPLERWNIESYVNGRLAIAYFVEFAQKPHRKIGNPIAEHELFENQYVVAVVSHVNLAKARHSSDSNQQSVLIQSVQEIEAPDGWVSRRVSSLVKLCLVKKDIADLVGTTTLSVLKMAPSRCSRLSKAGK